jgi:hypothetical protein
MTKLYRSARGKSVDIDKIKLANETTIAVGNMRTNARGDILGNGNNIAMGRNQVMDQVYSVGSAEIPAYSPNDPATYASRQAMMAESKAQELVQLTQNLTVPVQAPADTTPTQPAARGSLASSVAKPASVNQQPMPNPKAQAKANGPSRI